MMKTITVELPEELLAGFREAPEVLGRELRLAAAIGWLRLGRISAAEAAEVAGLGQVEFEAALATGWPPAAEESEPSGQPFAPEQAEAHYRLLGAWKGPSAAKDVQRAAREFWRGAGAAGARWLVGRLRDEVLVESLHAAGSVLADLDEVAIGPIVEGLLNSPSHDQAITLLDALGWLGESGRLPRLEGAEAELMLADRLQHDDPDMREAAACAMRLIRPERAVPWLEHRLRVETDPEVRRTIEEELARHR